MGRAKKECPSYVEALLGEVPDGKIAQLQEVSLYLVRRWREDRGIPPHSDIETPVKKRSLQDRVGDKYPGLWEKLGSLRDSAVAQEYGISRERVRQFRVDAGVAKYTPPVHPVLPEVVGKFSDKELAALFETTVSQVKRVRLAREVAPYRRWKERLDAVRPLLGVFSDGRVAELGGMPTQYVSRFRQQQGIAPFAPSPAAKDFPKLDRDVIRRLVDKGHTDQEIAILLECSAGSVGHIRTGELKLYKNKKGRGGRKLSRYKIGKIRKMYREGESILNISKETGHSWSTIKRYVRNIRREGGSVE